MVCCSILCICSSRYASTSDIGVICFAPISDQNPDLTYSLQRLDFDNGEFSEDFPADVPQPQHFSIVGLFVYEDFIGGDCKCFAVCLTFVAVFICSVLALDRVAPRNRRGDRIVRIRVYPSACLYLRFDCAVCNNHSLEPLYP